MNGSSYLTSLRDAARDNPVSAALIGIGAIWLLSGRARPSLPDMPSVRSAGRAVADSVSSLTDTALDSGSEGLRRGRRAVSDATDSAMRMASHLPDHGASAYGSLRETFSDTFERQPLVLGALGIAIGAGIAAAIPPTDIEQEYLGEASRQVRSTLSDLASAQGEKLQSTASEALSAASEEARRQGLTTDGLKQAASEVSSRLERVAGAATGSSAAGSTPTGNTATGNTATGNAAMGKPGQSKPGQTI